MAEDFDCLMNLADSRKSVSFCSPAGSLDLLES